MEMMLLDNTILVGGLLLATGLAGGYALFRWRDRKLKAAVGCQSAALLESARRDAEAIAREARLAATEEALKLREQNEKAFAGRLREIGELEQRLAQRENLINGQLEGLVQQEKGVSQEKQELQQARVALETDRAELVRLAAARRDELQRLSHLNESEARALLLKEVEQQSLRDAADLSRHILERSKHRAEEEARRIISLAIQRYAGHAYLRDHHCHPGPAGRRN